MQMGNSRTHPLSFIPRGWDWRILSPRKDGGIEGSTISLQIFTKSSQMSTHLFLLRVVIDCHEIKSRKRRHRHVGTKPKEGKRRSSVQFSPEECCWSGWLSFRTGDPKRDCVILDLGELVLRLKNCALTQSPKQKAQGEYFDQSAQICITLPLNELFPVAALGNKQQGEFFFFFLKI